MRGSLSSLRRQFPRNFQSARTDHAEATSVPRLLFLRAFFGRRPPTPQAGAGGGQRMLVLPPAASG
jgi:hypothetical protein